MKKFFNKNNKGFTLVELIVVIAVIAVISIMVAPRFIEYVEKSRRGTDRNAVKELAHAVQVGYVTIRTSNPNDQELLLTIGEEGNATYSTPGPRPRAGEKESLVDVVRNIIAEDSYVYKSKMYKGSEITISVDDEGIVTISATSELDKRKAKNDDDQSILVELKKDVDDAKEALLEAERIWNEEKNRDVVQESKDKIKELNKKMWTEGLSATEWIEYGVCQGVVTFPDEAEALKKEIVDAADKVYNAAKPGLEKTYNDAQAIFDETKAKLDADLDQINKEYEVAGELQAHINEFDN